MIRATIADNIVQAKTKLAYLFIATIWSQVNKNQKVTGHILLAVFFH